MQMCKPCETECVLIIPDEHWEEEHWQCPKCNSTYRYDGTISEIQTALKDWHAKNFPTITAEDMLIGVMEELGELSHANLKRRQLDKPELEADEKDAIGDIVIFLMGYCWKRGFNFCELVETVWEDIRFRDYNEIRNKDADTRIQQ